MGNKMDVTERHAIWNQGMGRRISGAGKVNEI